jgi:hypothetical protein
MGGVLRCGISEGRFVRLPERVFGEWVARRCCHGMGHRTCARPPTATEGELLYSTLATNAFCRMSDFSFSLKHNIIAAVSHRR